MRQPCQIKVALGTVKTRVKSILRKLEAASRTEAVAIAQRRGILRDERKYSRNGTDLSPGGATTARLPTTRPRICNTARPFI
jgi:hypothetical protein